jgi:hypothetical protein
MKAKALRIAVVLSFLNVGSAPQSKTLTTSLKRSGIVRLVGAPVAGNLKLAKTVSANAALATSNENGTPSSEARRIWFGASMRPFPGGMLISKSLRLVRSIVAQVDIQPVPRLCNLSTGQTAAYRGCCNLPSISGLAAPSLCMSSQDRKHLAIEIGFDRRIVSDRRLSCKLIPFLKIVSGPPGTTGCRSAALGPRPELRMNDYLVESY